MLVEAPKGPIIPTIGGYKRFPVSSGRFRLVINRSVPGDFADVSDFDFNSAKTADDVAFVLSRFCVPSSRYESRIWFREGLVVGVSGGETPTGKFYRHMEDKDPFYKTDSRDDFVAALKQQSVDQNEC